MYLVEQTGSDLYILASLTRNCSFSCGQFTRIVHFLHALTLVFLLIWRQVVLWPYSENLGSISFALNFLLLFDSVYLLAFASLRPHAAIMLAS